MFDIEDKVVIKSLDVLIKEGYLSAAPDLKEVYYNKELKFVIFPDFNFFGVETTIQSIDDADKDVPYFLSVGIWVPEFMIEKVDDLPKVDKLEEVPNNGQEYVYNGEFVGEQVKVYVNQFNGKKFGPLFVKLINLDEKIAEFSSTSFSRLKKHELQYIAKLLQDHGAEKVDYNKLSQKELAVYCHSNTLNL